MITINLHLDANRPQGTLPLDQIGDVIGRGKDSLLWLDVVAPTPDELRLLAEEFGFHPLAIEDAARRHQRPKIDLYDGFAFLVFYELRLEADRPVGREISMFVGPTYLVTVHDDPCPPIAETAVRWRTRLARLDHHGVGFLTYTLLDAIVDGYFPVSDALAERIDELEETIFEQHDPDAQRAIFSLRRDLTAVRRILAPERDVMNVLLRRDSPIVDDALTVYYQDIYDHILRVTDHVDAQRDLLASALDASLSVTSNRLNRVMRTLTASSIILMSTTLVASIYGMNFTFMPELGWRFGYLWALGLMASIGVTLTLAFRRIDWL